MRIERELMRGAGPVAVLKILSGGDQYGYELAEALGKRTGGVLDMGQSTLYPMLYNLEAKGLIRSYWQSAPEGDGGRERKYYALTDDGRAQLAK
nr:PadR family transcriptional regulator [Phycisphaerales bacterium]